MSKHTPGPWEVMATRHGHTIYSADAAWSITSLPDDHPQHAVNARLIAAAPDYDAAAKKMVEALGVAPDEIIEAAFGADVLEALQGLRAAIAKAEGQP